MKSGTIDLRWALRVGTVVLAAGAGLGGCASQQSYDGLLDANRTQKEQIETLTRQNQELTNELNLVQRDRTAKEAALAELQRLYNEARGQLSATDGRLKEFAQRMGTLTLGQVDPETDRALAALAQQYPDLIKYDAARGMLRFASDLTFASGDDAVQPGARSSLEALAKILTSGAAASYEVFIVGHTDTQPISGRTAPRHATNTHLSAHRAISVRAALASLGVPADKMLVAGWGEHRPIAPPGPRGNTPANRRVDIYLTRPTGGSESESAPVTGKAAADAEAPPARQPDMNK